MNKYDFIIQPPFMEKCNFLVDDVSDNGNWGKAIDIDKISYNLTLLGKKFNLDREIANAISKAGTTAVYPIGRFITIIGISKDEKEGFMEFLDYRIPMPKELFKKKLLEQYSEVIVGRWFEIQSELESEFMEELDDSVFLLIPPEL